MLKKKRITKTAIALSVILLIIWSLLGTASTIAWFSDSDVVINKFQFGEFDVELYRKNGTEYERVTESTKLFEDGALYEPGYTQVVYLKVTNEGDMPFDYRISILPTNIVDGISALGKTLHLPNYLKFGIVVRDTEAEAISATANREMARKYADTTLNNYDKDQMNLEAGSEQYIALILCMPEDVGNEANFRVKEASLDLGIKIIATQIEARS